MARFAGFLVLCVQIPERFLQKKADMNKNYLASVFLSVLFFTVSAQKPETPRICSNTPESNFAQLATLKVKSETEWEIDKSSGVKTKNAYCEYEKNGCLTKAWYPCGDNPAGGKYAANSWTFNAKGYKTGFRQVWYNKDSAEVIYHDEVHLLDSLDRYYESHFIYKDVQTGPSGLFDREDLYHRYDIAGYTAVTKHCKLKGTDSVSCDTYFFNDAVQAEAVRTTSLFYPVKDKRRFVAMDEKRRMIEMITYKDSKGREEETHNFTEYNDTRRGDTSSTIRLYQLVNGKKELVQEIIHYGKEYVVTNHYKNGAMINTHTEYQPQAGGDPIVTVDETPVELPYKEKTSSTVDRKKIKTVTTWREYPGKTERKDVFIQKFLPNGLLFESDYGYSKKKIQYEYTYFQ
ncbi:MAG: hypothetical protein FD123_3284 [Bacteroidetes bacterium]|nr:MAG: hypothetical protein FD123_3284 [Bacteroidota bacterium]